MASTNTGYPSALLASLKEAKLVPGPAEAVISPSFTPTFDLKVSFDGKPVLLGNFFKAGECKPVPAISFSTASTGTTASDETEERRNKTYLFMMIDPDAPTPADPKFAFWRHYVITGLTAEGGGEDGRVVTQYLAPGPKEDSGPHRYLFLLFEEKSGTSLTKEDVGGEEFVQRRSFPAAEFVDKHGLKLVGVNWMTCAWDGYVQ